MTPENDLHARSSTLKPRISLAALPAAALNVCSPFDGSRGLSAKMQLDACVKKALADAVTAIDKPALFAVYSAKMGKTLPARVASLQNR